MVPTLEQIVPPKQKGAYPMPDHGIKAVCFDLDGVLVNAPEWHKEAFIRAMQEIMILPVLSSEDHDANFNGLSTYKKLDILAARGHDELRIPNVRKHFYNKKQEFTQELIEANCRPVDRIIQTVLYANHLFGGKTAVVTNCSRKTAELMLQKSELLSLFPFIITNEDVGGKIKPHPWPYILAQNKLGLANTTKSILAIDDTGKGIMSAVDARMRTWWLKRFEDLTPDNLKRVLDGYRITI